jgi:hypothetical protein
VGNVARIDASGVLSSLTRVRFPIRLKGGWR